MSGVVIPVVEEMGIGWLAENCQLRRMTTWRLNGSYSILNGTLLTFGNVYIVARCKLKRIETDIFKDKIPIFKINILSVI